MSNDRIPVTLVGENAIQDPVVQEVFGRLAKGTVGIVNLHRTVANSPEVFAAFIGLAHALRFKTELDPAERELAILRVLELHHGHYEIRHHRKMALAAGVSEAEIDGTATLTDRRAAVRAYADAFAAGSGVPAASSKALAQHFTNRQIVELTMTMTLYLGLAHLTNSLDVALD